ncbi:MAG: hydantoinase/oxoprolinase family protein, partial [Terriglobia bacterium]
VVVNAYLVPLMKRYLAELEQNLRPRRVSAATFLQGYRSSRLHVMQSSGGMAAVGRIGAEPVRTILSGPAGGVAAAYRLAERLGLRQVISFDMGGTSTDVCLLDGRPRLTREAVLDGLPIAVPLLDIHSVGAGGGSLARIDAGGALRVGPESAGAEPGPACYARGGDQPTVTDANLILGRLDASYFLGGDYQLNERLATECFNRFLKRSAGLPSHPSKLYSNIFKLGDGIVSVANATMERALRVVSVERGHDPREFTLVSFGGAGGLHAADLARSLGIQTVVIPQNPGAFSALGVLLSDMIRDVSLSVLAPVPPAPDGAKSSGFRQFLLELDRRFQQLEWAGRTSLRNEGFDSQAALAERRLDVRYAGQGYELTVPMSPRFPDDFHEAHLKAHGHSQPGHALEIVSLRVRLIIRTPKPRVRAQRPGKSDSTSAVIARKLVWFGGKPIRSPAYSRRLLSPGMRIRGPAIVTEYSSTTVIPADYECRVDPFLNMVLVRHAG